MLTTNIAKLEATVSMKVGDEVISKTGNLYLDGNTPIELVKAMIFEFLKYVGQVEDGIKAQQAAVQQTETPAVEPETAVAAPNTDHSYCQIIEPEKDNA